MQSATFDDRWIQTYTGLPFWPLNPRPEHVFIEDIAHALSMKCRFSGHTNRFYSVAEHSVLVSYRVPPEDQAWALLHDASEAYLPDVARPIKSHLPGFREIEERVMRAVAERFGLPWPVPESVHAADLRLLATERRDFMATGQLRWSTDGVVEPIVGKIKGLSPEDAKLLFMVRWERLVKNGRVTNHAPATAPGTPTPGATPAAG